MSTVLAAASDLWPLIAAEAREVLRTVADIRLICVQMCQIFYLFIKGAQDHGQRFTYFT